MPKETIAYNYHFFIIVLYFYNANFTEMVKCYMATLYIGVQL